MFGKKRSHSLYRGLYEIDDCALPLMDSIRDLGIQVDSDLGFRSHIRYVSTNSKRLINLCFKMFTACHVDTVLSCYKLYVLPIIAYNSLTNWKTSENYSRLR